MHLLNRVFDKVVCINLAERKDKREKMQKKFDALGIEVEWFTAVQMHFSGLIAQSINNYPNFKSPGKKCGKFNIESPHEVGASISHYWVLKKALIEGAEKIFVFEDDCLFHKNFNNKFDSYWQDLPTSWDMISLYSFMYQLLPENKRVSNKWMRSYKSWSLMAYGMNKNVMKEYIERQDFFFTIADSVTFTMQEESHFNIFSSIPALCIPDIGMKSNIRNKMNYKSNPTITNLGYSDDNYE